MSARPAPVLADLSAAYLIRAERLRSPRDLLEAMEAAGRALAVDPSNPAARYNLALALDMNVLDTQATTAWSAYLRLDSTSAWAEEARRRAQSLRARPAALNPEEAHDGALAAFAAEDPGRAQLIGWDHLLGEWGEAMMAGDSIRAGERLRRAATLGAALERRGRDASLAGAVRQIRHAAARPASLARLARAHRDYARARHDYEAGLYPQAGPAFARVRAATDPASPLHQWATVFYGGTEVFRTPRAGEPILRAAAVHADSLRHPALAGRIRWLLGTSALRQRHYPDAATEYEAAARLLRRAGEREHLGAVQGYLGTAHHHLGNPAAAYAAYHAALLSLRRYPRSLWLHGALWAQADAAASDGYVHATAEILDEDVTAAARSGDAVNAAEALTTRARLRVATGLAEAALNDLRAGLADAVRRVGPEQARGWFGADLWEAEAAAVRRRDPGRALAPLDSAITFWSTEGNQLRLLVPLAARADLLLSLGRVREARRDLDRLTSALAAGRKSLATVPERVALLDAVRAAATRLAVLEIAQGRPQAALRHVEAARAAVLPPALAGRRSDGSPVRAGQRETVLVYALAGDTLLIWAVRDTVVRLSSSPVDPRALAAAAERARALLEHAPGGDGAAALPALQQLYAMLVEPAEPLLPDSGTLLTIVADPAFETVPFAALRDSRTARYLVDRYPLRVAATLAGSRAPAPGGAAHRAPALLVAATEFDTRAFPELERLPGATDEVRALSHLYPGAPVLAGPRATRRALLDAFPRSGMIHFAGHALFDDQHPERSRLLTSGAGDSAGPAELTAAEIERLSLLPGAVVVLSACETLRSPSGRTGGFAGLAGAFLAAGATGVVGSLWKVDDEATRALMTAFHDAYLRDGDGPGALRSAQLQMLRSGDPRHRSPAAWAGFRYVGQ